MDTLKQSPLHENQPHRIKNLFSTMHLQNSQENPQNARKIIRNVNVVTSCCKYYSFWKNNQEKLTMYKIKIRVLIFFITEKIFGTKIKWKFMSKTSIQMYLYLFIQLLCLKVLNEWFLYVEYMLVSKFNKWSKLSTPRKNFLWFKQNFFEWNKFVHCLIAKEKFHWFKEISWLFFSLN